MEGLAIGLLMIVFVIVIGFEVYMVDLIDFKNNFFYLKKKKLTNLDYVVYKQKARYIRKNFQIIFFKIMYMKNKKTVIKINKNFYLIYNNNLSFLFNEEKKLVNSILFELK